MSDPAPSRLSAQLDFLLEADGLKRVERRTRLVGGGRLENTAEHSWHLALFALVLAEHSDEPVDLARVMAMVVVHDIVEIDAGDTFAYDEAGAADKAEREERAADRLFAMLPAEQGAMLRALWEEYERGDTPEGRFAMAIDRLQPMLLNHANDGAAWREHGITADRVLDRNRVMERGSSALWAEAQRRVAEVVERGLLPEAR
ncbi:MAG TPA: HD domain-containing protein [Acidimicrobiales bacterium]